MQPGAPGRHAAKLGEKGEEKKKAEKILYSRTPYKEKNQMWKAERFKKKKPQNQQIKSKQTNHKTNNALNAEHVFLIGVWAANTQV